MMSTRKVFIQALSLLLCSSDCFVFVVLAAPKGEGISEEVLGAVGSCRAFIRGWLATDDTLRRQERRADDILSGRCI